MAPVQSTLRRGAVEQYARPLVAHYLAHRRRYSNLLMVAFSAYVLQNVRVQVLVSRSRRPRELTERVDAADLRRVDGKCVGQEEDKGSGVRTRRSSENGAGHEPKH